MQLSNPLHPMARWFPSAEMMHIWAHGDFRIAVSTLFLGMAFPALCNLIPLAMADGEVETQPRWGQGKLSLSWKFGP